MSLSHSKEQGLIFINPELIEKITLQNDLAGLTPVQKVQYVQGVCKTMGLNHLTQPIRLMKFQGKEIPYVTKDGGEQLRKINKISITKLDTKILEGGVYVATAYAFSPDGREDSSTGIISISGLKGDALANAMMKAETKAKRRVTLSICGLGFLDESEMDTMPGAQKIEVVEEKAQVNHQIELHDIDQDLMDISWAKDISELQDIYTKSYKYWIGKRDKDNVQKVIQSKDKRKMELESSEEIVIVDEETGEVK
jgi:hypothetical protein